MANVKGGGFFTGLLIGGAVGAISALLYTPRTGIENRELIKDQSMRLRNRTSELAHQVKDETQMRVDQVRSQIRNKSEELSSQTHQMLDRGREMVDRQREAVKSAVEAGRQAFVEKQTELQSEVTEDLQPAGTSGMTTPSPGPLI